MLGHQDLRNAGSHVLHTGGEYDSYLLVPVIPPMPSQVKDSP